MAFGSKRPKPMAPRRRCAVVSGRLAKERTPDSRMRTRKSGKRVSVRISSEIKGCWDCQTQPDGLPSTDASEPTGLL